MTGGRDPTMDRVFEYGNTGIIDEKANLQIGRYNHGCTSFSSESKSVRNNIFFFYFYHAFLFLQFYIVTGGQKNQVDLLDSTEIYDVESNAWAVVTSGPFPVKVAGLRLTNIKDMVLAFGKIRSACIDRTKGSLQKKGKKSVTSVTPASDPPPNGGSTPM